MPGGDDNLPLLLTDKPWAEMVADGRTTASLAQYFKNVFPDHELRSFETHFKPSKIPEIRKGTYNYVVLKDDQIVLCKKDKDNIYDGHIDLANKEVILAGGECKIWDGQIKWIDNASGHYLPKGPSAKLAVFRAFAKAGINLEQRRYVEKEWNGKNWVKVK